MFWYFFFFFKQKTAYEMRISDWSSDVCSSDLKASMTSETWRCHPCQERVSFWSRPSSFLAVSKLSSIAQRWPSTLTSASMDVQIGRASCRERVCQYV